MSVLIETTLGDIVVDLYVKQRPTTCTNFLKLCKTKFYNFCLFHSVEQNFIAQTGDPTATGRGGQSIFGQLFGEQARFFEREQIPPLKHIKKGTLSMVNNGHDSHGSQFFLTLSENLDYLDDVHTVFGEVTEGFDTLDKLNETFCDGNHRPYQDIRITHTIVLDDPFPDQKGLTIPSRSPSPTLELLKTARIGVDEDLNENEGKTAEQIQEEIAEKEARARAHVLEMVGDLHHAEEKPPDNVLFVCKLNAVTTEDDLEIIFSRFGKIKCCEIIKDKKSGNSLQYAFIEFETPEECENAFFKMDNVLIDDRRIHVDFSQSVSKNFTWDRRKVSGNGSNVQQQKAKRHADEERGEENKSRRKLSPKREDRHERKRSRNRSRDRHRRHSRDHRSTSPSSRKRHDKHSRR